MKKQLNRAIIITFALILSIGFTGQPTGNAQVSRKFKVNVGVTCDDKNTQTMIEHWVKRELRNLSDVVIVDEFKAEWLIVLVALEGRSRTTGRKLGGICMSVVYLQKVPGSPERTPHFYYPYSGIQTGETAEYLEDICKSIVANFDIGMLERIREIREK